MASERDTSGRGLHIAHQSKTQKNASKNQSHLTENSSQTQLSTSPMSNKLTPMFDREENSTHLDISSSYNGASSSEESDYNQASVIFSLDELQSSMTASLSPEPGLGYHNGSTGDQQNSGKLFPGLVQDESTSEHENSREEEIKQGEEKDQNTDQFNLAITPPTVDVTPLKSNDSFSDTAEDAGIEAVITQPNVATINTTTDHINLTDTLLANSQSVIAASTIELNGAPQPNVSADIKFDNSPSPFVSGELSPIITPHLDTPVSNDSLSHTDVITVTDSMSSEPQTGNAPIDSTDAGISSVTTSLSEKLKPAQNNFESPGLLFAHPVKKPKKKETFEPAEAATEALLAEEKSPVVTSHRPSHHVKAKADKRGEMFVDQSQINTFKHKHKGGKLSCVCLMVSSP